MAKENEIVLFETKDKEIRLSVPIENETVWLSQTQMVELFDRDQSVISRHINNSFDEEVDKESNMHFLHIANSDKPVAFYSLDVIISVGYRVKSRRGIEFRRWANKVLKDYIIKGYAINDKRLEALQKTVEIQAKMLATAIEGDSDEVLKAVNLYTQALTLLMESIIRERFNGKYPVRKSIQTEFAHIGGKEGLQFQVDAVAYCGK